MSHEQNTITQQKGLLTFWGVRGSIPSPGEHTVVHGGNTSCVSVEYGDHLIILDAGTGIRKLGLDIQNRDADDLPEHRHIFITHYHWDHIQGLPFFSPAFDPQKRFRLCGEPGDGMGLEKILGEQMQGPFFPISMDCAFAADIDFKSLACDETFQIDDSPSIELTPFRSFHPNQGLGFRLDIDGFRITYLPDNELDDTEDQSMLYSVLENSDILIHDAQFKKSEIEQKRGWGHSAFEDTAALGKKVDCGQLFLFHHDPESTDSVLSEREKIAQEIFPRTQMAYEGLKIPFGQKD